MLTEIKEWKKESIKAEAAKLLFELEKGNVNALDLKLTLKAFEAVITECKKVVDELALNEALKFSARSFDHSGAKVEICELGTSYDFSECGYSYYSEICEQEARVKLLKKDAEDFLKLAKPGTVIMNKETGELENVNPPVKKSSTGLKITFK